MTVSEEWVLLLEKSSTSSVVGGEMELVVDALVDMYFFILLPARTFYSHTAAVVILLIWSKCDPWLMTLGKKCKGMKDEGRWRVL